jgi:hypothetical protein
MRAEVRRNGKNSHCEIYYIKNILVDACYNDLALTAGDKTIVLTGVQATWTMNIIIQALKRKPFSL